MTFLTKTCIKNILSTEFPREEQMHYKQKPVPWSREGFAVFRVSSAKGMWFRSQQVLCAKAVAQEKRRNEPKLLGKLVPSCIRRGPLSTMTSTWGGGVSLPLPPQPPPPPAQQHLQPLGKKSRPPSPNDPGFKTKSGKKKKKSRHILWHLFWRRKEWQQTHGNPTSEYRHGGGARLSPAHHQSACGWGPGNSSCTFGATWTPVSSTAWWLEASRWINKLNIQIKTKSTNRVSILCLFQDVQEKALTTRMDTTQHHELFASGLGGHGLRLERQRLGFEDVS